MKLNPCLIAGALGLCVSAAPSLTSASSSVLPDVAAEYSTEISVEGSTQVQNWKFWREGDRLQRQNDEYGIADTWQRDGKALIHLKLFIAERRGIEFQQEDLQMLQAVSPWTELQSLLPLQIIEILDHSEAVIRDGTPQATYSGRLDGVEWNVVWRTDLGLPSRIEKRTGHRTDTVVLRNATPVDQASWRPVSPAEYSVIDFADLGDHEQDPFVQRVQALIGGVHRH